MTTTPHSFTTVTLSEPSVLAALTRLRARHPRVSIRALVGAALLLADASPPAGTEAPAASRFAELLKTLPNQYQARSVGHKRGLSCWDRIDQRLRAMRAAGTTTPPAPRVPPT